MILLNIQTYLMSQQLENILLIEQNNIEVLKKSKSREIH